MRPAQNLYVVGRTGSAQVRLLAIVLVGAESPFGQKAQRMLQEVKKIVPDPCVPR
jgi:hypothetical protein